MVIIGTRGCYGFHRGGVDKILMDRDGKDEMKMLVCGKFNDQGGKTSGYGSRLYHSLSKRERGWLVFNGGPFKMLEDFLPSMKDLDTVVWLPDVPNDKEKLVGRIKEINPKIMLVTSKNNYRAEKQYRPQDLIQRALKTKSNLLMEFTMKNDKALRMFAVTLWDPLGNVFIEEELDVDKVADVLVKRLAELRKFSRVKSSQVGDMLEVPDEKQFFEVISRYGEQFHKLIHGTNVERFLGNASFRCTHGFPSFRHEDLVFVSKRNVDKREIGVSSFVPVKLSSQGSVEYYGPNKPSVDTPVQTRLYSLIPGAWYMLHSHCYVHGAPMTDRLVPCGAIEEVDEVLQKWNAADRGELNGLWTVNLRGHGSLAIASNVQCLNELEYVARPFPEKVER